MFATVATFVLSLTLIALLIYLVIALVRRSRHERQPFSLFEKLVYLGLVGTVGVLGVTSLYSVIAMGAMRGWMLWGHMTAAGAFIVALTLAALLWAETSRLGAGETFPDDAVQPRFSALARVTFWLILASGLVSLATMAASMYALVGTDDQLTLLAVHRYSGLVLVVATAVHACCLSLARFGLK